MKQFISTAFAALISAHLFLTGCGGGSSTDSTQTASEVQINTAGIKGPLAFADAKVFAFDPSLPDFYDELSPLSSAVSDQFASVIGLSLPVDTAPPYILTIGGVDAIDLNTGEAPVIAKLIIVITQDMLDNNSPIYATPLSTLAFHMARLSAGTSANANTFTQASTAAADQVSQAFAIDQNVPIDILRSPVVINTDTVTLAAQKEAVYHRAALEAFAVKVYKLHLSNPDTTTDSFIESLALDLQSDGIINNSANDKVVGNIDPAILSHYPMKMLIPNTSYRVEDIVTLMEDERVLLLTDQEPPPLVVDNIGFGAAQAPPVAADSSPVDLSRRSVASVATGSFPVNLRGRSTISESVSVTLNISKPADATDATIKLMVYDADNPNEGELIINGNTPVTLFEASGVNENDGKWVEISISTPASYWQDGGNTLVFRHLNTYGFIIDRAKVSFTSSSNATTGSTPTTSVSPENTLLSVNFDDIDRGGASKVRYTAAKLEEDFNWNALKYSSKKGGNGYFGPLEARGTLQADSVWIVPDPAGNSGRGNVLRVTHLPKKWGGGGSGASWRADFTPQDEVWFSYDLYLDMAGNWSPLQEKLPGLITGTMLEASHPGDQAPSPDDPWRGVSTFTMSMQSETTRGGDHGAPALAVYRYDARQVQKTDWLNDFDPTQYQYKSSKIGQYMIPRGQWITIEQHWKRNTTDSNASYDSSVDRNNGIEEVYINGVLKMSRKTTWSKWDKLKADGFWVYDFYGGNGGDPRNIPPTVQHTYFDNFWVTVTPRTYTP